MTLTWPYVTDKAVRDIQIRAAHTLIQSTKFEASLTNTGDSADYLFLGKVS